MGIQIMYIVIQDKKLLKNMYFTNTCISFIALKAILLGKINIVGVQMT